MVKNMLFWIVLWPMCAMRDVCDPKDPSQPHLMVFVGLYIWWTTLAIVVGYSLAALANHVYYHMVIT